MPFRSVWASFRRCTSVGDLPILLYTDSIPVTGLLDSCMQPRVSSAVGSHIHGFVNIVASDAGVTLVHCSWEKAITTANHRCSVSIFESVDSSMVLHCIMGRDHWLRFARRSQQLSAM